MTYIVLTANCLYLALVLYVFYIGRRWSKFITRMNKAMDDFENETAKVHEELMAFFEEESDDFGLRERTCCSSEANGWIVEE